MRAYASDRFGQISDLSLRDLPKPTPAPGEVLVRVKAAGVNPADLKVLTRSGAGFLLHASKFPLVLGYDFSGTIESADSGQNGQEVYGFLPYARSTHGGTFAEYVAVGAGTFAPKPKRLSHEEAAAAATGAATALQGLRDKGRLTAGQSVLVNGASGGVGTYAVQIARAMGATVIGTCSAAKAEQVKGLGAERVYDYRATRLSDITERFDVVFDVASNSSFGECSKLLKPGGTYVVLLPSASMALGVIGSLFTSKRSRFLIVVPVAADLAQIGAWFDEGKLTPVLDTAYPLAELPKALERQKAGDFRGKLAITV